MEAAFQEVRTHLGVETRRQWPATAIARTTPALLSRLIPVAHRLWQEGLPACDAERGLEWDIESSVPAARGNGPDPVKPTGRFSRALSRRAARLPNPGPDAPLRNQRLL